MNTDQYTIRLDGELTIYQVGVRYEQLQLVLQQSVSESSTDETQPSLMIETRELTEVDSAGLQLLVQVAQQARRADITIHWQVPSTALRQMIDLYNVAHWFETP